MEVSAQTEKRQTSTHRKKACCTFLVRYHGLDFFFFNGEIHVLYGLTFAHVCFMFNLQFWHPQQACS